MFIQVLVWSDGICRADVAVSASRQGIFLLTQPSVQKRIRKILPDYMRKFNQIEWEQGGSAESSAVAARLSDIAPDQAVCERMDRMHARNSAAYTQLISFLITHLATPNLHWFYTASTISLLDICLKECVVVPAPLVDVLVTHGVQSDLRAGVFAVTQ